MECPFCDSDQWKMASLVYQEGLSHFSARTFAQNLNQFDSQSGSNRIFDTTGTQQSGLSKLAAPPKGYTYTWILVISLVFLFLIVLQAGFFAIPALIVVIISIIYIYPKEKEYYQRSYSNWCDTRMCLRCGKFYIPFTNWILDSAGKNGSNSEAHELNSKANVVLVVCFLCGLISFKYADFFGRSARWLFVKVLERNGGNNQGSELGTSRSFLIQGVEVEFVKIPPGKFLQGSNCDTSEREHYVSINQSFFLGKFEVKQDLWIKVMGENPSFFVGPNNPVDNVSWNACEKFINRLNRIVSKGNFRFPTESEWEYACKAGVNKNFYFGDKIQIEQANFGGKKGRTMESGMYPPNAFGLYDMHGNVAEWVNDWYGPYKSEDNFPNITPGKYKVLRGGSYNYDSIFCRSASRGYFVPQLADNTFGLRIAWEP